MEISYDYYRVFYYAAQYRSFTAAAEALYKNQPNVTRVIKLLEHELGCTLFSRSRRGAVLTPEGEKLYDHIRIAVEHIEAAEEELASMKNLHSGIVAVGASEVALRCFLLPILRQYREEYPGVRVKVSNYSTPQALQAVKDGLADFALVTTPVQEGPSMAVRPVKEIREVAVAGPAFSFLGDKTVSLAQLHAYPIVSLGSQTVTYAFYSALFAAAGLEFVPDIEAATADQILPLVRNNLGIGFVPEDFLLDGQEGITTLSLAEEIPKRRICFIRPASGRPFSAAAKALERMILA